MVNMTKTEQLAQAFDSLKILMLLIPGVDSGEVAAHLRKQDAVLKQALDALKFAYNACDDEWVQDNKIDPAIAAIQEQNP